MNIIEVRDLKKYFPIRKGVFYKTMGYVKAVDGVSLSLEKGKTLGVVGESGSGKSTLAKLMVKLLQPDAGEILLKGREISSLKERDFRPMRRYIQIVFQDPFSSLDPRYTVSKIIEEGMELRKGKNKEKVVEFLNMVGLSRDSLEKFPHEFSGGQRQRISIARALATEPEIIILDEPVSSLDLSIQAQIINLLLELQERFHLSYIFIAHDLRVVRHVSDEIYVMYQGKVLEYGPSEEIFRNPFHPYTQLLISTIPRIGEKSEASIREESREEKGRCLFYPRCSRRDKTCQECEPQLREVLPKHFVSCLR